MSGLSANFHHIPKPPPQAELRPPAAVPTLAVLILASRHRASLINQLSNLTR
ncbi:hypothetical protein VDG1235_2427 [Verrucomicrobiia bacterium DG1235]|nr:hypothetical protein VDG1235_2427 [Verrucomicrobiae bacterium DG1235]